MGDIKGKINELSGTIAAQQAVELIDVAIAGSAGRPLIRVYIDKEGGVTLDDCGDFSRALSALLDVEDPIPSSYVLEVSSPGLDRPLKEMKDFQRSIGKLVKVVTRSRIEEQNVFIGRIEAVSGETILLALGHKKMEVPFEQISKARLEIELK